MPDIKSNTAEERFLSEYSLQDYDRPSVAADITVFSMFAKAAQCHRKDDEPELSILLIKRGEHPYMNKWALPGGFLKADETVEACAMRELREETNLIPASILPVGIFSDPGRDPRGRIISAAFASVISEENVRIMSGGDAIGVNWFSVQFVPEADGSVKLTLTGDSETLTAQVRQTGSPFSGERFEVIACDGLAFDHAKIIAAALSGLKERAENFDLLFDFLPEKFTLTSLQKAQEILLGVSMIAANFRRKVAPLVVETEEFTEGAGHRPARLFRRKV